MTDKEAPAACVTPAPVGKVHILEEEWTSEFLPYYISNRGTWMSALDAALTELGLDAATAQRAKEAADRYLDGSQEWKDALGNFGEAHLSYVLERKRAYFLTRAAWKEEPFATARGVDLVAVRLADGVVCFVESKARGDLAPFLQERTLAELRKQLGIERLEKRFAADAGPSSLFQITATYLHAVSRVPLLPSVDRSRFHRIGAIVVPHPSSWPSPNPACPCDIVPLRTCELIDLRVEDLEEKVGKLVALEIASKKAAAGVTQ